MGYTSQQGQIGFGVQSVKGTPVAATRFGRFRSGALAPNRELLIPDPEIGGNRDIPQAYLGPISYAGSYEFYVRMELLALLMRGAFGTPTSSSVVGASETQTLTTTGVPTGGDFTISYRGQTTAALAFDADAVAIDAALEALTTIGAGNVTVGGGPVNTTPVTVAFAGALALSDARLLTVNDNGLTGGTNPTITVTTTTPGFSAKGTHVFVPSDENSLPWLSVEERIGFDYENFGYTDAKVSKLAFEIDAEGYMTGTVDLVALTQLAGFTPQTSPAIDTSPMIVGSTVGLYWNGVLLPAKSLNFEINNNMEDNDFRLGSFTLGDLTEKRREFKIGCTIRPTSSALWKEATYGGAELTTPRAGRASYGSLRIEATSFENVQGALTPYTLTIEVPTAAMAPFAVEPSGDDVIEHDIEFTLLRDDPVAPICTATIVNGLATVT